MPTFNPDYHQVIRYFNRFLPFKTGMMFFLIRYINEPDITGSGANRVRGIWKTDASKVLVICKEFGLSKFENFGFIYLIVAVYNNKEERNQARVNANEYWMQLKSLIDALEDYDVPAIFESNKTDANPFNEIRFFPKRDSHISISNPRLIFNLVASMLSFLRDHYKKSEYDKFLGDITPYVGLKNAPGGFAITRDKLVFSINEYLSVEEPHLSQNKRSRVIKELFGLTSYPINIAIASINKRISRDKKAHK